MKHILRFIFVLIALMFPTIVAGEPTEEQESICDKPDHYDEDLYISIAQIHERLVSLSWPYAPPIYWTARVNVYAVFQIKVSTSGEVCAVESIGGNTVIIPPLTSEIKKWKFRPNKPFWGAIVIRYVSSGNGFYFL